MSAGRREAAALPPLLSLALSLSLAGCGAASDGAALVHGRLFAGQPKWETSMELTCAAAVHGAGPFRVLIARAPQPGEEGATGFDGKAAGLTIEMIHPAIPEDGATLRFGGEEGPLGRIERVVAGALAPPATVLGRDTLYDDGSFTVHAEGGSLTMQLEGRSPGDAAVGRFEITIVTGETVWGTFAATFVD